jgi:hypothetical protein
MVCMLSFSQLQRVFRSCSFSVRTGSFCFISPPFECCPRSRGWYSTGSVHLLTHWHTFVEHFERFFVFNWFLWILRDFRVLLTIALLSLRIEKKRLLLAVLKERRLSSKARCSIVYALRFSYRVDLCIDRLLTMYPHPILTATSRVPSISVPSNLVCKTFPLTSTVFLAFINWMFLPPYISYLEV